MRATPALPIPAAAALLLASLLVSCVAGGAGTDRSSSSLIGEPEIRESMAVNAYELVQRHRAGWLRGRGSTSLVRPGPELPIVYLENMPYGTVASLRRIETASIREVRFLNAADATTRFGTGHMGGVIQIFLRSGSVGPSLPLP